MFAMKKIVAPLLLPPGIFILLIGLVGVMLLRSRRWRLGLANLVIGLVLWALSIAPVANGLMFGLESGFSVPDTPTGDVIVVLGGGVISGVPDMDGKGALTYSSLSRIVAATRLYQRLRLPIIVTGGRVYADIEVAEATIAKRFLAQLGVPEERIIEEDRARDTSQNARLTAVVCRQHGFSQPIVLTAAYHLKRARLAFDAAGMPATFFPAYFLGAPKTTYTPRHLLPTASALHVSAKALHEYVGIWYYRLIE